MTAGELFQQAFSRHRAGQLAEAESLYRQALAIDPNHAESLHLLGLLMQQAGQPAAAVELLGRSVAAKADVPEAWYNYANALRTQQRGADAVSAYRRAIALKAGMVEAHCNLGNALADLGDPQGAIESYRRAIALKPDLPEACLSLGRVLLSTGNPQEAVAPLERAAIMRPQWVDAYHLLGIALSACDQPAKAASAFRQAVNLRPDLVEIRFNLAAALVASAPAEAIEEFRRVLALKPDLAVAHAQLGRLLAERKQYVEAIAAFRQATSLQPADAQTLNDLGLALVGASDVDGAIAAYRQAIAIDSTCVEAYSNLGTTLLRRGRVDEAISACRTATQLQPDWADLWNNLGNVLRSAGQTDDAVAAYRKAIQVNPACGSAYNNLGALVKDLGELEESLALTRQAMSAEPSNEKYASNLVYGMHFQAGQTPATLAAAHREWQQRYAAVLERQVRPHANDRNPERRLRIGYVSPDFRKHPVGRFLLPLFTHHDKRKFAIYAYSNVLEQDATTRQLRQYTEAWRNTLTLSDEETAELIRQDGIDILVDLTMHMADNRLLIFARKPAPLQMTYLAYCSTTGLKTIDYRLSDPHLDPPADGDSWYTEQTIRLPHTYWCYDPPFTARPVADLPALRQGTLTFGSLNNYCKVNPEALSLWARILRQVDRSRLLLHTHEGMHRQKVLDLMRREGIEPERIEFSPALPLEQYLAQYDRVDIALDTFPYGGGTTTCDAIWCGVPVITWAGDLAVGRGGVSILSNVGLSRLIAPTREDYVRLAVQLAGDLQALRALRGTLRECMKNSPLMDGVGFARAVEEAYRTAWRKWCAAPQGPLV